MGCPMEGKGKQCDQKQKHEQSQDACGRAEMNYKTFYQNVRFVSWKGHPGLGNSIRDC